MKALVYTGPQQIEFQQIPTPEAEDNQCIVDIALCGICGSDMHAYHGHDSRRVPPLVLGHEAVGIVQTGNLAGKRVAINPLMTCGKCAVCISGHEHLCEYRELIGMRVPGAFAEQLVISEKNLTVLADDFPFERAVLAEPLACAVHAVDIGLARLNCSPKDACIVVLGGGAIGLLCALVFKHNGVKHLWIAETNQLRRKSINQTIQANIYDPATDAQHIPPADIVLDAVGSGITRKVASQLVAPGGTIVHIGLQSNDEGLDTRRLTLQEITFVGTYCYTNSDFAQALSLLQNGKITERGWTEYRTLQNGKSAFMDIHKGKASPKIILEI